MRKIQIGVIGSMGDTKLSPSLIEIAEKLGKEIAKERASLSFCFEGDWESLPVIAAKSAEQLGGETVAFVWEKHNQLIGLSSTVVNTGQLRGGGREFSFVLSCDAIISIAGGSGTLMEISMAYQAGIPVIVLENSGGWSKKLANTFLDERKRQKIIGANTAKKAVNLALKLVKKL